ncbi:hypothetical protein HQ305_04325 [Rhodococcus sp. BP-149]|uniref:hypothetical protein n=1 Tax=unclassified Rhodococcus (in: high G+C Gram-positive bacteria) TaxID=192944 RepID=UPI001C9B3425|nr:MULTISPECIES: hypothetical protein [unclassified Rhodococcus (in: high G+C Gram-positive bacteria)]MBY6684475.1 hypothetical protein [Rhodococcus sp. BP-288]MBY6696492.1 hypothetical protein [Rhodococcus sp. BP-188]MBY6697061.1 hypothetical protein [Rhodococcus sp. BP-285]MBY6701738.1 hypothetical protein [Rhodococcus sp. BP-283]MBY6710329.1 hypothetical protein [Rhodococcus sp. BP-160]
MTRLSVVDEIFLRTHRGFGIPVAMQGLWVTEEPITPGALDLIDARLAEGRLGVRIVSSRLPGARRRWVRASGRPGVRWTEPTDDPVRWAESGADVSLDPEYGPGWRLTAAPCGNGTAVSLVCSHVIADARGLIDAAAAALSGVPDPIAPDDGTTDTADALATLSTVVGRTAVAVSALAVSRARRAELMQYLQASRTGTPAPARPDAWEALSVSTDVEATQWDRVAADGAGTPNVVFLSVVAAVVATLRCSGTSGDTDGSVLLGVPMKVEAGGANAISVTAVRITESDSLADIRRRAKTAYRSPLTGPAGFPDELLHVVPERAAALLAPSTGRRDALCSNIGPLPEAVRTIGGRPAVRVAARAIHPGLRHEQSAASPTILSAYLCRHDHAYTLSVVVTDPAAAHSVEQVRDAIATALGHHHLTPDFW